MTAYPLAHDVHGPADAPVVVLGSSVGTTRRLWDRQLPALAERLRVVRYDHVGHGASAVPASPVSVADLGDSLVALMDELGARRAHLVGLSLGGVVALQVAQSAPDRVDRVALVCSSARIPPPQLWTDRAAAVRRGGMASVVDAVLPRWFTPDQASSAAARQVRDAFVALDPEGYALCCEAISATDLRPGLGGVRAPLLAISGAQDPATPPEHSQVVVDGVRAGGGWARHVVLDDAAHLANLQQPQAVSRLLLEHLTAAVPTGDDDRAPDDHSTDNHSTDDHEAGMAVRRAVLGDAHVDRAVAGTTGFTADFQQFITRYAWGGVWTRPGLDRRARSCVTLAVLASLGHDRELAMHVRAAVRNGLTPAEIAEVLLQVGVYAGVPAANTAFAVANEVLVADGLVDGPSGG